MKRKNRSRSFDDDEQLVADILLQIPQIIFESESRFPFNWGFRRTRSDIDRSLSSHPKRKRIEHSYEMKKEDRLKTADGLTHQQELLKPKIENVTGLQNTLTALNSERKKKENQLKMGDHLTCLRELKSEIENLTGLHNTWTAVKSETKLNLVRAMAKAKAENGEQVHIQPQQPPPLPFLRRHSAETTALVPSTSGSIVVYPISPFVVVPHVNLSLKESPPLNVALYFDPTQSKRAAAAQARKKRCQIYRVKKPKVVQVPLSSLLVGR